MNLFDNMLKHDETLFRNEIALDYDYLPHILKFRENQQQHIATIIKPLFQGRMGSNLIITGKPGIGKTAACKHVLRDMEQHTDKIKGLYVNCWKNDSAYKVIIDICNQIGYKWVQNKKTNELMKEIGNILNKKACVIILDEVDKLKEEQVIYYLLEELTKKCLIMISNEKEFISYLDQRTRSRLMPEMIEFHSYTFKETFDILNERKQVAFFDNIMKDEDFEKIVEKTVDFGDIRTGLFLLKESANAAEIRSSKKIEPLDVDKAISKLSSFQSTKIVLDDEEKELIKLITENNGESSSHIYKLYNEIFNKSDRTFRRKIAKLKDNSFIHSKEGKDDQGNIIPYLHIKEL
ncbi:MAG: AAA family ATPase [Nanoarchaeota archaeon]|nr:AAA family ATPase [Nanoarchaeota archaeon]